MLVADKDTAESRARGCTHEIRINGRTLLVGDDLSILTVANNLSGSNFKTADEHQFYCRFLVSEFWNDAEAAPEGAALEVAVVGGAALVRTKVGSRLRMRSDLLSPGD